MYELIYFGIELISFILLKSFIPGESACGTIIYFVFKLYAI